MTSLQRTLYDDALRRSRKTVFDVERNSTVAGDSTPSTSGSHDTKPAKKKSKINPRKDKMYLENSTNVLMDLRKAASHPMLFRSHFTDDTVKSIARALVKEPDFKSRGAVYDYVREDLEVMTDAELQVYMATYKVKIVSNLCCHIL
jgi:SWI/SNF-related matrix-associated actin-dependent regulator 1 of chromatin subfamily A